MCVYSFSEVLRMFKTNCIENLHFYVFGCVFSCNTSNVPQKFLLTTYLEKVGSFPFFFLPKYNGDCCCYIIGSIWENPGNWDKCSSFFANVPGTKGKPHHVGIWMRQRMKRRNKFLQTAIKEINITFKSNLENNFKTNFKYEY